MNNIVVKATPPKRELSPPRSGRDFDFFYQGLARGELLVQECSSCGAVRNPPSPMCGNCRSLEWSPKVCAGTGHIYSYTVHYHPQLPSFSTPHIVVLAEMTEGFRLVASMPNTEVESMKIGMSITAEFSRDGEVATFYFRQA